MIKILLVDDHALFRRGLVSLLEDLPEVTVVGEASNGCEAVEAAKTLKPDLIFMDIHKYQIRF